MQIDEIGINNRHICRLRKIKHKLGDAFEMQNTNGTHQYV